MNVIVALAVGVACAALAIDRVRTRWRLADVPTSDAGHVFPGLSEVYGVVEPIGQPAAAASDGRPCVWWRYEVEQYVKRGKNSEWVTREEGATAMPFLVRDQSGAVRVVLETSDGISNLDERDIEHLSLAFLRPYAREMKHTFVPGGGWRSVFGGMVDQDEPTEPINQFHGTWRANEKRLCVGDPIFITAHARITPSGDQVELASEDANGRNCTFELTRGDERAAVKAHASAWQAVLFSLVAVIALSVGGAMLLGNAVVFPVVLFVATPILFLVGVWNRVRRARERCSFAWSLIDVACEQRSNLVPELQAVVGAAMAHERSVLDAVAAARSLGRTPSPTKVDTVKAADAAASHVVATVEATPSLYTQANVAQLMDQVRLLTDRVAFGRRFYNDAVLRLENRRRQFPDSLIARLAHVSSMPYIDNSSLDVTGGGEQAASR